MQSKTELIIYHDELARKRQAEDIFATGEYLVIFLCFLGLNFANACVCQNARIDKTVHNRRILPRV